MIYPSFLKKGDTIGVCAPSDGISKELKLKRIDNAYQKFKSMGYLVYESNSVRHSEKGRSASGDVRALELEELFLRNDVSYIICATGGDFLVECLPFIDWNIIANHPKWMQGYSDPTALLFYITTSLDIATIYGSNIGTFGMEEWHESISNNMKIATGEHIIQQSFQAYEGSYFEYETGLEGYQLDSPVYWKNVLGGENVQLTGRMLGGCIDVLLDIIATPYDHVKEFLEKYRDDGIIWYFDNAELSNDVLTRALWHLKANGWFQYTKGILFGRSFANSSYYDISLEDVLKSSLGDLNCPVIMDVDFGHVAPRFTIVNGAICNISSSKGKGSMEFIYR